MNSAAKINGFDHLTIVAQNLADTRRFYGELLSLPELPRPSFEFPGIWFDAGNIQIHVIGTHKQSGPLPLPQEPGSRHSRSWHFAFDVDHLEGVLKLLRAASVPIVDGIKSRPDGMKQLFVLDPDGYIVELCQRTSID